MFAAWLLVCVLAAAAAGDTTASAGLCAYMYSNLWAQMAVAYVQVPARWFAHVHTLAVRVAAAACMFMVDDMKLSNCQYSALIAPSCLSV